jgi:hypothetical protein
MVHKPHVVRSLIRRSSKANPGAYRSYRVNNVSCFAYLCMWRLCTMCRILYDGDRLHGSTLTYVILDIDVFPFYD